MAAKKNGSRRAAISVGEESTNEDAQVPSSPVCPLGGGKEARKKSGFLGGGFTIPLWDIFG
jgi:hypothetical protein